MVLAHRQGFEPRTPGSGNRCPIQLGQRCMPSMSEARRTWLPCGRMAVPTGIEPVLPERQSGVLTSGPWNRDGVPRWTRTTGLSLRRAVIFQLIYGHILG